MKWSITVAIVLIFTAAIAQASEFTGSSNGIFIDPLPAVNSQYYSGVNTDSFTWGSAYPTRSNLTFSGVTFSADADQLFKFGTLDYFNGTIVSGTGAESIRLDVTLAFTTPSGITEDFVFPFVLINTLNTSDPWASADYVIFQAAWDPTKYFTVGNIDYTLNFLGIGTLDQNGQFINKNEFHVLENAGSSANLYGQITANPHDFGTAVPEPSTILLLGAGLGGLAFIRRRLHN